MTRRAFAMSAGVLLAASLITTPVTTAAAQPTTEADDRPRVLVFHGPADDQRDPVQRATDALVRIGGDNGLAVDSSSDPAVFSKDNLDRFRSVVFLSANGVTLTTEQEAALKGYITGGGGFLGIADAAKAQPDSSWFTGLIGTRPVGARPTPEPVSKVTANADNPPREIKENLTDGNQNTKWLAFAATGWVSMELAQPAALSRYSLTSANDFPTRDLKDWALKGSTDGTTWVELDKRTNETFPERFQRKEFEFANTTAYKHYRLDITKNAGATSIQLADFLLYRADSEPVPDPEPQESVVHMVDRSHPATEGIPATLTRTDRWLNWSPNPIGTVHTVAQVDESKYNPGTAGNGPFHPISWCRDYEGGRSFYTGMGATDASYGDANFREHLTGALKWTTGQQRADCQATIAANYQVEKLTAANKQGELDQIGEPHGLEIAPDGTVFYVGKAACPSGPVVEWENPKVGLGCGTIHQWKPGDKKVKLLTTLPVMGNRGSGTELVKNEEGLLGLVVDPDFADNGWIYVYWMPHASIDRTNRIGERTVSRFTYDHETQTLDQATRVDLLKWHVQIHSCCHAGGGMAFDSDGNLYIGSGDSNSSQGSEGYSGNNWKEHFKGLSFQDARRTSGNTNDLNGKILRIHPEADGRYTIPDGNLFDEEADDNGKTRPEIYVMGVRNISRLAVDPKHDWVTAGWVGPDASSPNPELGPAKYETATIITEAGNHGWPYCMGNRQPYRDRSNVDSSVLTGWYDCDAPKNESPRNTGLVDLPPVKDNMIWYAPDGGGPVFPDRGNGIPSYKAAEATYTQPYLRGGGQAVMSGPTYHRDLVNTGSGVAWPRHWDGKWFIGDQSNSQNRIAVTVDPAGVPTAQPPLFAETLRHIVPAGSGANQLQSWMDAKFGPDGALYLLDYAGGFFSLHANQKLIRVVYKGGAPTPAATASSVAVQSKPLTVAFTGEKSGGVSYLWDFGDGTTSTEANPRHTFPWVGPYTARLTVTYADGEKLTTRVTATVGCLTPDTGATVTFDTRDTKVPNGQVGGGCRIDDLFDDESTWAGNAAFVDHVREAVKPLRQRGIITVAQRDALVQHARQSPIGKAGHTGYEPIFDGTSTRGWTQAPGGSFAIQPDGSLRSAGGLGMLWYAQQAYGDFSVTMRFRDIAPENTRANSGVFVRFPDPRTPLAERPPGSCGTQGSARTSQAWVAIFCGQEIQIYDGTTGETQKTGSVYNFDPVPIEQAAATPKGDWNLYEVRVVGQRYTITRNGKVINEFDNSPGKQSSRPGDPPTDLRQFTSGYVGLQNHGDADVVEFRDIRVRQL
jgi:glucose/arabinose dehydrogenase